jgi:hypothetical protein
MYDMICNILFCVQGAIVDLALFPNNPNSVDEFVCDFSLKGIPGNPILKGVVGELLAFIRPAI